MPRFVFAFLFVACLVNGSDAGRPQELHFWGEELGPIFDILARDNLSGFLQLSGEHEMHLPSLPIFRTVAIPSSPLRDLRAVVADVPGMHVSRNAAGIVVMKQKSVPDDVLRIRITRLELKNICFGDIYSATSALMIIFRTPEVAAYADANHIELSPGRSGGIGTGIGTGAGCGSRPLEARHFSASMKNVTVLQALERVFGAFPGEILVYWNVPKVQEKGSSSAGEQSEMFPNFYSECSSTPREDSVFRTQEPNLPDPFCLPPAAFMALRSRLLMQIQMPHESTGRQVFFWFFQRKRFGDRMIITGG
jgi:hypothetical protein